MVEITQTNFFLLLDKMDRGELDKICKGRPEKKVNPGNGDVLYVVGMTKWMRSIGGLYFADSKLAKLVR